MASGNGTPSSRDVIDVSVPSVPDPVPETFLNQETGELLTEELASFARERSGTCGGIGVGLEVVDVLLDDLRSFDERGTRPGELRHHIEMIEELEQVLVDTADAEIDSYESSLYEEESEEDENPPSQQETSTPETEYPRSAFKIAYVDRISGSNNILAIPRDGSCGHLHISSGVVDKTRVLYDPNENFDQTKEISEKPVALPFHGIEEAQTHLKENGQIPTQEGDIIQLPIPCFTFNLSSPEGSRSPSDSTLLG